jgi:hypothetical protein
MKPAAGSLKAEGSVIHPPANSAGGTSPTPALITPAIEKTPDMPSDLKPDTPPSLKPDIKPVVQPDANPPVIPGPKEVPAEKRVPAKPDIPPLEPSKPLEPAKASEKATESTKIPEPPKLPEKSTQPIVPVPSPAEKGPEPVVPAPKPPEKAPEPKAPEPKAPEKAPKPAEKDDPFGTGSNDVKALRMWTDASGNYRIEARFVSVQDGVVRLQKANGRYVRIAYDQLCSTDQGFVINQNQSLAAAQ